MSIPVQTPQNEHTGNGVTTVFAFDFTILQGVDLVVRIGGVVQSGGYTISGIGDRDGGSIVTTTAPAIGVDILLTREVALKRDTDYQENGDLLAETLDDDFDRLWMAMQDRGAIEARSLRAPVGEVLPELPSAAMRANAYQAFDSSGNPIVVPGLGSASAVALALSQFVVNLASTAVGVGSSLVGWMRRATGAVARTVEGKAAERVSLEDFGGVGDWNGTTGTDNLAAMVAAQNYLTAIGGTLEIGPGAFYFSAAFKHRRGVNLRGSGQSHPAFFNAGTKRGTSLVIAGASGASLVEFESGVEGHHGIQSLAIYQQGTAAIYAALSVRGVLSPFVRDCTIYCTKGIGLAVGSDASNNLTLYGAFDNLHIRGETAVSIFDAANANTFTGGSWAGTKMTLEVKGPNLCRGLSFNGVSIEGSYTAGSAISYDPKPTKVYGWIPNTLCYTVDYVSLDYADGAAFNGGYTELGGVPSTYDDGTHGVLPLIGTVHVKSTSRGVSFNSCRWASFMVDEGVATYANNLALTDKVHTTQTKPYLFAYQTATQNIPKNTDTTVAFGSTLNSDLITLTANAATVLNAGLFNIKAQVNCGVVAFQEDSLYIEIWVNGSPKYRGANHYIPGANGGDITLVAEQTLMLADGDVITINMFHNSGTAGTITLPADFTKTNLVVYQV